MYGRSLPLRRSANPRHYSHHSGRVQPHKTQEKRIPYYFTAIHKRKITYQVFDSANHDEQLTGPWGVTGSGVKVCGLNGRVSAAPRVFISAPLGPPLTGTRRGCSRDEETLSRTFYRGYRPTVGVIMWDVLNRKVAFAAGSIVLFFFIFII